MRYKSRKLRNCQALTILEIVIALAIITIVFAVVLPQFRVILNSWDTRQAKTDVLQNGRVLISNINRNLRKAVKITAVSDSSDTNGFIEFLCNDGNNRRYDINNVSNYVEFGLVGNLYNLAGPVDSLTFTSYDVCDLDIPLDIATADINDIRFINVQATLPNPSALGQDITFTTSVYLRTNDEISECDPNLVARWKLDETSGLNADDSSGNGNDGTLRNMVGNEWITDGAVDGALNFDGNNDYVAIQNLYYEGSGYPEVTVAAWIRTNDGSDQIIASFDRNEYWRLEINGNGGGTGQMGWDVRTSTGQVDYGSTTTIDDGQWHHVVGVFDNGTLTIYIDGNPETSASGGSTFGRGVNTRYGFLGVGSEATYFDGSRGPNNYFNGDMDDVRIYDRALDANEIAQLAETLKYVDFTEAKVGSDSTSITIPTPSGSGAVALLGSWTSGLTHTAETGSNRVLIFTAHAEENGNINLNSVTYGGQTMTKVIDEIVTSTGYYAYVAAFILNEAGIAAATSDTFVPTWSTTPDNVEYGSVFLQNVDQTDPIGASASNTTTSSDTLATTALSTNEGDMVILAATCGNTGDYTLNNGFTETLEHDMASSTGVSGYKTADGSNETPSVTHSGANRQVLIGFVVQIVGEISGIEDDLLIAAVATDGDTSTTLSPPADQGWIGIVNDYSGQVTLGAWYKIAGASEPASHQFTWSGANPQQAYGWIMHFTGHDPANPINAFSTYGETSSTPTSPAVTTTVNNCIILRLGAFDNDDITEGDTGLTGHTTITMTDSGASGAILFQDDFEGGNFDKWTDGGTTNWNLDTSQYVSYNHSAHAGNNDDDLISDNIDTSSYGSFTIDFWYRVDDIDWNDDVYLQFYNGSTYVDRFEVGDQAEDTWLNYNETVNDSGGDSQYFINNFRIKFEGTSIDSGENLWIDDVTITVPPSGMVSGGAGYLKQSAAGDSGNADFALTSSNASQMVTVAIAPVDNSGDDCGGQQIHP
jgi:type II secretory pathway pseudopilin PulG